MKIRNRVLVIVFILSIAFVFSFGGVVLAADSKWSADYWDNKSLSGSPDFERNESNIDHDWGDDSPDSSIPDDDFSARWTRTVNLDEDGYYRFSATFDDGMRVWIDDDLIIDEWEDGGERTVEVELLLDDGDYDFEVEYYENNGDAVAIFDWEFLENGPTKLPEYNHWVADYFNNTNLSGSTVLARVDDAVDFDWGTGSPGSGVNSDNFSVRWRRTPFFDNGTYRFTATFDDGMRVYVNGNLIIDQWHQGGVRQATADFPLTAGDRHEIIVEYFDATGTAVAKLSWERISNSTDTTTTTTTTGGTYTVQGGDYLNKIATQYGVTLQALIDANVGVYPSLRTNPNLIYVGWVLTIPGTTTTTTTDGQGGGAILTGDTYTVQSGDSLIRIANLHGVTLQALIDANASVYPSIRTNPDLIYRGWVLSIP